MMMMMMFFVLGKNVESDLESFTENKIFYILKKNTAALYLCVCVCVCV